MTFHVIVLLIIAILIDGCCSSTMRLRQRPSTYLEAHDIARIAFERRWKPGDASEAFHLAPTTEEIQLLTAKGATASVASAAERLECARDLRRLAAAIWRGDPWALAFPDSMGKPQPGLLNGANTWLGSFDQCLQSSSRSTESSWNISGSYCLLKLGRLVAESNTSAQKVFTPLVTIGTCWPDSCTMEDAVKVTEALLGEQLQVIAGGDSQICYGRDKTVVWSPGLIIVVAFYSAIALCLLAGTAIDLIQRSQARTAAAVAAAAAAASATSSEDADNPGNHPAFESSGNGGDEEVLIAAIHQDNMSFGRSELLFSILLCFSIPANARKILQGAKRGHLESANGIRFLSMSWIVLGHTYYVGLMNSSNLGQLVPQWLDDWTFRAILNATVAVDTFFVLSGLLATYLFLQELHRRGNHFKRINWLRFYLHRYLRLTIPYFAVLGAYATLAQYIWDGPRYPRDGFDKNCETNWWRNLLYINNMWDMNEMCMPWSWYLANDMQFYVVSPLILVPLALKPALGVALATAGILASVTALGIHSTQIGLAAGVLTDEVYTRPWFRVAPYLVGCLAGFAAHRLLRLFDGVRSNNGGSPARLLRFKHLRAHWLFQLLMWTLALGIFAAVIYSLFDVDRGRYELSQPIASLYNCLFRLGWSVGVAMMILACATENGGIAGEILSSRVFATLSRLSYCAYLLHPAVITAVEAARRDTIQWNAWTPVGNYLAYLLASYAMAFVASLAFESPLIGLERLATNGGQ